jgi:hypothetical protein
VFDRHIAREVPPEVPKSPWTICLRVVASVTDGECYQAVDLDESDEMECVEAVKVDVIDKLKDIKDIDKLKGSEAMDESEK